ANMKVKITADSTCDLGKEQAERFSVYIMPLTVVLGDKVFHDGVDITPRDIFDYVDKTGVLPKTGAPSIDDYESFFEKQLADADAVIHINISRLASSSHDNACVAAKKFNGKVFAVDSMALSTGQGLLAVKACELAAEGREPRGIVEILEGLRGKINTSFVPDRLDYLHKGGRCSLAAMLGAKVLKLHPMIDMKDGKLYAKKKYMGGLERCLSAYVKDLAETYPNYDRARCFITHSNCEREVVEKVKAQVESLFGFEEIIETTAGCVVTGHCGKNTLGVLFICD
ncbi:MAG: DegV family protein, partial [Clostridia bacterium]|nr:DegV family protein [Clostridia bacterium]